MPKANSYPEYRLEMEPTLVTSWPVLIFTLLTLNSVTPTLAAERLYDERDNVIPTIHLADKILEPGVAKLVQFMNAFSNESQKFIPIYTQLARDVYRWNRILKVYVIDCANEAAIDDCQKHLITSTPTLLFFPSDYSMGPDKKILSTQPIVIKSVVARYLGVMSHNTQDQPIFELLTSKDNVSTVFDVSSRSHLVLVYEPRESNIGRDTILDLLAYSQLEVRILGDRRIFKNFGVKANRYAESNLVIIDRAGKLTHLPASSQTSEAYVFAVEKFVKPPHQKELEPHQPVNLNASLRQIIFDNYATNRIYLADLERAIDHMLRVLLVKVPNYNEKELIVLQNIITLLNYLNPLIAEEGKNYLHNIYWSLQSLPAKFLKQTDLLSHGDNVFYGNCYVGCIGSQPGLRGFNCSLWTLFHYLTVAASEPPIRFEPGVILWALHGYANYFMGCPKCYENFWLHAQKQKIEDVKTHDEEILWLWEAHNHFNEKLVGDITEDPRFPKKQFPEEKDCSQCRNSDGEWQRDEVLTYLKSIYSLDKLSWLGLSTLH